MFLIFSLFIIKYFRRNFKIVIFVFYMKKFTTNKNKYGYDTFCLRRIEI